MSKRKKKPATDKVPDAIHEIAQRFVDDVNDDPHLIQLLEQFEAADREREAADDAEVRHVKEMHEEEQQLMNRLAELRSQIKAASDKSTGTNNPT